MTTRYSGFANKTYAAEHAVWSGAKAKRYGQPIGVLEARTIAAALGFDDVIIMRPTGKNDKSGFYMPESRSSTQLYRPARIALGKRAGLWMLLHELAHHRQFTCDVLPMRGTGHDVAFRRHYLWLVYCQLGGYWYERLKLSFERFDLTI